MKSKTLQLHMRTNNPLSDFRTLIIAIILLLLCLLAKAQAPQQFSFQGVARDAAGKVIANKTISIQALINKNTPSGENVFYQQLDNIQTDSHGIFNIAIGSNFSNVDWKSDKFFLNILLNLGDGNFVDIGTTQLLSVPYALYSSESGRWKSDDPIIQIGTINSGKLLPNVGSGSRLIWYPRMGAFRVGTHDGQWEEAKVGLRSFATGENTEAVSQHSVAMGKETKANGSASFALGTQTTAQGERSLALGNNVVAKASSGIALGAFNNLSDDPIGISQADDRIFQIGNGVGADSRSNVMTILRNGNIGLGNSVLNPQYLLDIGGRARITHNGNETAGIYFDASQNAAEGFVGMKTNNEIGLYINTAWRFWVNNQGNGYLNGNLIQTSDRRLKTNIQPFKNSLGKVNSLQGYHYNWEDKTRDQTMQTGLIAQEVEQIFPELVSTNKDGFKSVNYIGLVPHLVESVKELKSKTDEIAVLRKELEGIREMGKRLELLEASLNKGAGVAEIKTAAK
ncbi:tail fiber domain-containing protein [Dyadobacter sp. CY107]|uniref:tail fiber domain-containing protein n=1 Tax=Dyadobacter fanqingshengii TaxID=2906443 RepID=UPI001F3C6617|nr:tail fiber domain-containing protein [Dyadobacter fanqingshengii]MCF2505089.1 tail fiber domain-containing protein [Dyadobacter fanqingshengii]